MTIQKDLSRIWAFSGVSTDPGTSAYAQGWVAEIPTYQEFNYILQGLDKNLLALAEQGNYTWQADINYVAGTKVYINNLKYTCITNNINNNPTTDTNNSYWVLGDCLGGDYTLLNATQGLLINNVKTKASDKWDGNELTLVNNNSLIALNAGNYTNWLLGNVQGSLVTVDTGITTTPDGRDISLTNNQVYKIYHEGFKPVVTDVANALNINPINDKTMGRYNSNWVEVVPITHLSDPDPHSMYLKELDTPTQVEAEAGLATTVRAWSALRVKQAIHALGDIRFKSINTIDIPVSTVITVPTATTPVGFLECNGAALSRVSYADLFANIGTLYGVGDGTTTFNLPDLRGEFIRGWDSNGTIDSGRIIGSSQNATAFRKHLGNTVLLEDDTFNNLDVGGQLDTFTGWGSNNTYSLGHGDPGLLGSARPRNVAMMYVIKY